MDLFFRLFVRSFVRLFVCLFFLYVCLFYRACLFGFFFLNECFQDLAGFKAVLKNMWFTKYAKGDGVPSYSGFEHTFVGIKDILSFS